MWYAPHWLRPSGPPSIFIFNGYTCEWYPLCPLTRNIVFQKYLKLLYWKVLQTFVCNSKNKDWSSGCTHLSDRSTQEPRGPPVGRYHPSPPLAPEVLWKENTIMLRIDDVMTRWYSANDANTNAECVINDKWTRISWKSSLQLCTILFRFEQ